MSTQFKISMHALTWLAGASVLLAFPASAEQAAKPAGTPSGPGSLSGVWFIDREYKMGALKDPTAATTASGDAVPMLPWAADRAAKELAAEKAGRTVATAKSRCLPEGLPVIMPGATTEPMKIVEDPEVVTVLVEAIGNYRQIYLNAPHNPDPDPTFMGDSVAHWEGDTLVVDTIGFNDQTSLGGNVPHTESLHMVERFRRISPERMQLDFTIEDPKTFTRVWTLPTKVFKMAPKGTRLIEFVCENQRNAPDANGIISFNHSAH